MVEKIGHKNAFQCGILIKIAGEVAMGPSMRKNEFCCEKYLLKEQYVQIMIVLSRNIFYFRLFLSVSVWFR